MPSTSKEAMLTLALQALQNNDKLSEQAVAKIYGVDRSTLARRRAGKPARQDITPKSRKLTELEEETIVQYTVELDTRGFPPRLRGVEDMANQLLRVRDAPPVGKLWAHRFVKRQPALHTR
jgi:transcriptional regulator with XRE-family HTH domain